MRLRQICLVAEDLQTSLETLAELLGSPVMYRDPEVAHFGLENGLIMTGGDFDEAAGFVGAPVNVRARVRRARRGTERADGSFESRVGGSSNRGARRCAPAKRDGCGEASVNRFRHAPLKRRARVLSRLFPRRRTVRLGNPHPPNAKTHARQSRNSRRRRMR